MVSDVQFKCSSGLESIFTDAARDTYIFQMIEKLKVRSTVSI